MSGKQRPKSERIVRSCQSDAWSRSKSAGGAALPMEGEKASHAACLSAQSAGCIGGSYLGQDTVGPPGGGPIITAK